MSQLTLFRPRPKPKATEPWILGARGPGKYVRWRHCSGWWLEHCGHPTALYPFLVFDPKGRAYTNPITGKGFRSLKDAKAEVERRNDLH